MEPEMDPKHRENTQHMDVSENKHEWLVVMFTTKVIAFDELKTENKNPIDQCNSLNPLVIPEYLLHFFFNFLFLFGGQWFSIAINVPLLAYHFSKYQNRPIMSSFGLYDPTSILNANNLNTYQREGWVKLAFYLFSFFYYLYGMIRSLITV